MVALAQKRVAGRARVIQGDISDLRNTLDDQTFDLVLSSLVLHYQADLSAVFADDLSLNGCASRRRVRN
jgi:ubiquinone/menaquinone biosynthesis C-methylase UbiE